MGSSASEWVGGGVYEDKGLLPTAGKTTEQYDVAILGAGFEGATLGLILAHQGVKVLLIDSGIHPRFALGESTVRHTFRMMKIIGERFNIPEIKEKFSSGEQVHKHVASSCGEKRNFGFVYHRRGEHQHPEEANQLVIPPFREGYEAHLFRQDTDTFLTN
jgi:FADH2 O2-dependent halogenase